MQATSRARAGIVLSEPAPWPNDPLGYCLELPRSAEHSPFGYPVRLATNSSDVLLAAEESWSGFPQFFSGRPLDIRVAVRDDGPAASTSDFLISGMGNVISMICNSRNFAVIDWSQGTCECRVTAATAADRPWFRYMFLDTIVNVILWQTHLTRIHAGCVERNGRGVLLCGDSGAGKTCLTYACARRGWTLISDEAPSLLRRTPERIVIGKPHLIHLRESAFPLFPELQGREAKPNPVGKISIEVRTGDLPGIRTGYRTAVAAVVFLNRSYEGRPALAPLEKDEVWRRFAADLPYFGEPAHGEHKASIRNLLGADTYELCYSDLDAAVDRLEALIDATPLPPPLPQADHSPRRPEAPSPSRRPEAAHVRGAEAVPSRRPEPALPAVESALSSGAEAAHVRGAEAVPLCRPEAARPPATGAGSAYSRGAEAAPLPATEAAPPRREGERP